MSTTQATLHQYQDQYEWTSETFTKTVIFNLRPLTERKRDRARRMIESAEEIRAETARRLPSIPRQYWATARPANSTYYEWAKSMDSHLANPIVHENIQSVRETFRSWQSDGYDGAKPETELFANAGACSITYDKPRYKKHGDSYYVSIPMAAGRGERELLPLRDGDYLREYAEQIIAGELDKSRAELIQTDQGFRLHQGVRTEVDVIADPQTMVGVDVGLTNLAAVGATQGGDKVGAELWSGQETAEMRRRFSERRKLAQTEKRFENLRHEESKFVEHVCHTVSREIVDWALNCHRPKIVMEDLTDIRDTFIKREREHSPADRRVLHSWAFDKLQTMIEYKAQEAGVPTAYINPKNTSRECNECGHTSEDNRSGVYFACQNCNYQVNADVNAAFNIGQK